MPLLRHVIASTPALWVNGMRVSLCLSVSLSLCLCVSLSLCLCVLGSEGGAVQAIAAWDVSKLRNTTHSFSISLTDSLILCSTT